MKIQSKTKPQSFTRQVCERVVIDLTAEEAKSLFRDLESCHGSAANDLWQELESLFGVRGEFT